MLFGRSDVGAESSPHPAIAQNRRVRPTRIAPVTLFLREDAEWLTCRTTPADTSGLSHPARDVLVALERNGASFFAELPRQTGRLASEVEDALWELLAGGFVTADGFDNLRALIDPKRRQGEGRGSKKRPRHAAGRWALLRPVATRTTPMTAFSVSQISCWRAGASRCAICWFGKHSRRPWRELLPVLRSMEARGEIRGRTICVWSYGRTVCSARSTRPDAGRPSDFKRAFDRNRIKCRSFESFRHRPARSPRQSFGRYGGSACLNNCPRRSRLKRSSLHFAEEFHDAGGILRQVLARRDQSGSHFRAHWTIAFTTVNGARPGSEIRTSGPASL